MGDEVMNLRSKNILINFVLVELLFLVSCTAQPSVTKPVLTLTNTPLPKITSTANSSTKTPLPAVTESSTLSPENAYLELEDLLKDGCELPCWAGITPGITLAVDASISLLPFAGISDWESLNSTGGEISLSYPKDNLLIGLYTRVLSLKKDVVVQLLNISAQALEEIGNGDYKVVYDAQPYHELLAAYSLQNVLATYGKPSEILMTVEIYDTEPGAPDFMMLWLMCPEKGFIAKYTANAEVVDGIVHGCPSKTFVELWLFSTYDDEKYKEDLLHFDEELGYVLPTPSIRTKPISDGIDMSFDEFYQIFSQPMIRCLQTPRSIWPEF